MAPVGAIQAEFGVRFNKKLFSHSCHEFEPRAVRAQALAAVACGGACASVFRDPRRSHAFAIHDGRLRLRIPDRTAGRGADLRPRRQRSGNERDSSRVSGVGPVGDRVVQPGQSFGIANGRLAPRPNAAQVVPATGAGPVEKTQGGSSGLLVSHRGNLTRSAEKTVEDTFFGFWHCKVVELSQELHWLGAIRAAWIFRILKPHRNATQCACIV